MCSLVYQEQVKSTIQCDLALAFFVIIITLTFLAKMGYCLIQKTVLHHTTCITVITLAHCSAFESYFNINCILCFVLCIGCFKCKHSSTTKLKQVMSPLSDGVTRLWMLLSAMSFLFLLCVMFCLYFSTTSFEILQNGLVCE